MSSVKRPSGLIANKGIELLTAGTPNGLEFAEHQAKISVTDSFQYS
jgi:hypothetical protein